MSRVAEMVKCRVCDKHTESRDEADPILRLCGEPGCLRRFAKRPELLAGAMSEDAPIDEFLITSREDHYRICEASRISQRLDVPYDWALRALADDAWRPGWWLRLDQATREHIAGPRRARRKGAA